MANTELKVALREGTGKGAARAVRRAGNVPGVIYGGDKPPVAISVQGNVLLKKLRDGGFLSTLVDLEVDGAKETAICRAVQRDVVKDLPVHVDVLRLTAKSRIDVYIHVNFVNEDDCPGLRKGGVLTIVRPEVELNVLAGNIPESLTADLTGLDVGDTITISNIALPEGTKTVIQGRDFVIANISAPSAMLSAAGEEDDAGGDGEAGAGAEDGGDAGD